MTKGRFRHLPVMADPGLVDIVDITDVCRALLDVSEAARGSYYLIRSKIRFVQMRPSLSTRPAGAAP